MLTFTKLDFTNSGEYLKAFQFYEPYADYYFNNLFTWLGQKSSVEWAQFNEGIILKFINPFDDSKKYTYSYLAKQSSSKIFEELTVKHGVTKFSMLPAISFENIEKKLLKGYTITVDSDNSDYIYNTESIIKMIGPKSKGFLRQVNYYLKNHSVDSIVQTLDLRNNENQVRLINSIHIWQKIYTHNDTEKNESKAIERYIKYSDELRPKCVAVVINDKIEAFSIYSEPPQKDYIILSHAKTSYEYKGLFDFLVFSTLSRACAETPTIKLLNFEQDLGIAGLKQHKMSMKPIKKLYKYEITKN